MCTYDIISYVQEAREELYKRTEENELTHFLELNSADEENKFFKEIYSFVKIIIPVKSPNENLIAWISN